ncbi:PilN domain-containing protein [Sporosarcina newyorkensis]|uniref:Type IV pilus assembly protein PilN n=1 Tax=Sporosarcina newyorkensis TaxID=759851 RepID=A0A1T4XNZ0_9BACL|nr:hypothetical protein [Sporosarcina newyorkensis]SKA90811.1 hypothetical protein SAMN04244570_1021 [Sporosarcina newyorkensis]
MLVDINLLPEKLKERSTWLWVAITILAAALISWAVLFWLAQKNDDEAQSLQQQAFEVQKQQEDVTSQLRPSSFGQEKAQLAATVEWLEGYQYKTVPLLQELVHALPERGFFSEFTFTSPNEATFDVQFDDVSEAAHYLTRMKASSLINGATFELVETVELTEEELSADVLPRYVARYFVQFLDERAQTETDAIVEPDDAIDQSEELPLDEAEPSENEEKEGGGVVE